MENYYSDIQDNIDLLEIIERDSYKKRSRDIVEIDDTFIFYGNIKYVKYESIKNLINKNEKGKEDIFSDNESSRPSINLSVNSSFSSSPSNKSRISCTCKKSKCLKKYCECYKQGTKCGIKCNCYDCSN